MVSSHKNAGAMADVLHFGLGTQTLCGLAKLGQTVAFTCMAGRADVAELILSPCPPVGLHFK